MMQTMRTNITRHFFRLALVMLAMATTGCGDPYKAKIPLSQKLTANEVLQLSSGLAQEDKATLEKWAKRMSIGEDYGGEPLARTVKDAIVNQQAYEAIKEQQRIEKNKKIAKEKTLEEELRKSERQREAEAIKLAQSRQKVDAEIRKNFEAKVDSYMLQTLFNNYGYEYAREWVFKLVLKNKSDRKVIGVAGWVTVYDVFNNELGSYQIKIEPIVNPNEIKGYYTSMTLNRKDPGQIEMIKSSSLRVLFFFESLAFADGKNIDARLLLAPPPVSQPDSSLQGTY